MRLMIEFNEDYIQETFDMSFCMDTIKSLLRQGYHEYDESNEFSFKVED